MNHLKEPEYISKNRNMVGTLCKKGIIANHKVESVMKSVNRGEFVDYPEFAYYDMPQSIGFNATISAPYIHSVVLQVLSSKLTQGAKALDIGCGSGYLWAAMQAMMKHQGHVVGIEHIPELAEKAVNNISKSYSDDLESNRITIMVGDGRLGYADEAPYDWIHVGAASEYIPDALIEQLKIGGLLVIPIGNESEQQDLVLLLKTSESEVKTQVLTKITYVPLTSKDHQLCRI